MFLDIKSSKIKEIVKILYRKKELIKILLLKTNQSQAFRQKAFKI